MSIEVILLNAYSSEEQAHNAAALARFLTNQQQSIHFMRELDRVPANSATQVDPRLYQTVAGFSRQARTAVTLPGYLSGESFFAAGDRAYTGVLSGSLTPEEAVCQFGLEIIAQQKLPAEQVLLPDNCISTDS